MLPDNKVDAFVQIIDQFIHGPSVQTGIVVCSDKADLESVHFAIATHFVYEWNYVQVMGFERAYAFNGGQLLVVTCLEDKFQAHRFAASEFDYVIFIDLDSLDGDTVKYMSSRARRHASNHITAPAVVGYITDTVTGTMPPGEFLSWFPHYIHNQSETFTSNVTKLS